MKIIQAESHELWVISTYKKGEGIYWVQDPNPIDPLQEINLVSLHTVESEDYGAEPVIFTLFTGSIKQANAYLDMLSSELLQEKTVEEEVKEKETIMVDIPEPVGKKTCSSKCKPEVGAKDVMDYTLDVIKAVKS